MNRIKTILVVLLLLACTCMPCAVADNKKAGTNIHGNTTQDDLQSDDDEYANDSAQDPQTARGRSGIVPQPRRLEVEYRNVTDSHLDSTQKLQVARNAYKGAKTSENRRKLEKAAQTHLLRTTDRMIKRLEVVQARIEADERRGFAPEGASENIDRYMLRLEGKGSEIRSADTAADIVSCARSIEREWKAARVELMRYTRHMIVMRIEQFLDKAETLSGRLDGMIDDLEDQGVDTANLRENLRKYDTTIECVRENHELAKTAMDALDRDEMRQYVHEANVCVREANQILKDIFRELRGYRMSSVRLNAVILNGTGTLTAEGSGTAVISGSINMSLTADAGMLSVCDRDGDMNIMISGNGTRTQEDSTVVYTGFNGSAYINGSDVTVTITGSGIELEVEGTGTALLTGTGSYSVTHNGDVTSSGEWHEPDGGSA